MASNERLSSKKWQAESLPLRPLPPASPAPLPPPTLPRPPYLGSFSVSAAHISYIVLDDLSKEEARGYFVHLIDNLPIEERKLFKDDLDCFDFVFSITGGRILFLQMYVAEVSRSKAKISGKHENQTMFSFLAVLKLIIRTPARNFSPIVVEKSRLELELLDNPRVSYSATEVYEVMSNLTASGRGYISYKETVQKLGAEKVKEMIARNILHFRPVSSFPSNLEPQPFSNVLVPTGMPALRAMEFLHHEFSHLKTVPEPLGRISGAVSWLSRFLKLLKL